MICCSPIEISGSRDAERQQGTTVHPSSVKQPTTPQLSSDNGQQGEGALQFTTYARSLYIVARHARHQNCWYHPKKTRQRAFQEPRGIKWRRQGPEGISHPLPSLLRLRLFKMSPRLMPSLLVLVSMVALLHGKQEAAVCLALLRHLPAVHASPTPTSCSLIVLSESLVACAPADRPMRA